MNKLKLFHLMVHCVINAIGVALPGMSGAFTVEISDDRSAIVKSFTGQEMAEPLQMLAAQIRGNFEAITTWAAKYEFIDRFYFPGPIPGTTGQGVSFDPRTADIGGFWEVTRGSVEFQWDIDSDQLHVFYKPTTPLEYIEAKSEKRVQRKGFGDKNPGDIYHWIMTPEHWTEFGTNVELGQLNEFPKVASVPPTGGRIAIRKARNEADHISRIVNPRDLYSNGSQLFWQHLELYVGALRGSRTADERSHIEENVSLIQRTRDGVTEFVLKIQYPRHGTANEDIPIIQVTFDSSAGFNPTYWIRSVGKEVSDKRVFTYKKISDAFIPARFEYQHYEPRLSRPAISRTFNLRSATLNEAIPAGRFGIEQLGLKYGERMLDEIENQLYVMDDTGLVPVERFSLDPKRVPSLMIPGEHVIIANQRNWALLILNVLVVFTLVLLVVLRRRKAYS